MRIRHHASGRGRPGSSQSGASIILAMAFIGAIFALMSAMVSFTQTETRSLQSYRADRAIRYAGDSALESAIAQVQANANMGWSSTFTPAGGSPTCSMTTPVNVTPQAPLTVSPTFINAVTANSNITVTCKATSDASSPVVNCPVQGATPPLNNTPVLPLNNTCSGGYDTGVGTTGAEYQRDVTFTVTCSSSGTNTSTIAQHQYACPPSTATARTILVARVLYAIDPTKSGPDTPQLPTSQNVRATVPQVLTWTIYRN